MYSHIYSLQMGKSKKVVKQVAASVSSGSSMMMLGTTFISSVVVIVTCSFGIWLINSLLMQEIATLRNELSGTSKQLSVAEEQLKHIPVLQSKLEKAVAGLKSAEKELEKLREEVAKPTQNIQWNQLPLNLTQTFGELRSKLQTLETMNSMLVNSNNHINSLSAGLHSLKSDVTGMETTTQNLEKCFHCPCDFDRIVDSCYFIQRNKLSLTFDAAAQICASKNASLVTIDSLGEFHSIRNFLVSIHEYRLHDLEHGWLTGARRVDGQLQWTSNNAPVNDVNIVWGVNEPSGEECVTFFPLLGRNLNLADISCEAINRQFICEL